ILAYCYCQSLIPVNLAQELSESTVSARIPDQEAAFFPQSDLTVHRIHRTREILFILHPPQVPFDVAGYPVAPPNLQLEQVHVYVRHGTRQFPITRLRQSLIFVENRRTHPGWYPTCRLSSKHWMMFKTVRRFKAAVTGFVNANSDMGEVLQTRMVVERRDGRVADGECLLGELTDIGRQFTFSFGKGLRRLYIE
ncbi:hypothetical protein K443DRAFT_677290, partial [Laccaria amethystina LaAM-08-1]